MRTDRGRIFPKGKIKSLSALKKIILKLKRQGKKIVFTNGCFDLLHAGHAKYLEDAKRKGDILVVALNSDASVKRLKGDKRPLTDEKSRLNLLAALESVDFVTLFKEDTPLNLIMSLKPDVLVKGADWQENNIVGAKFVLSYGGRVSRVKLVKGLSSTNLIKKIAQLF